MKNLGKKVQRRSFCKSVATITLGAITSPLLATSLGDDPKQGQQMFRNRAAKQGKASIITLLHTADIHGQLFTHDELFIENGKEIYKKRGGLAVLKTMVNTLRKENPGNTILIDGGDTFQGSGVAALSEGRAIVTLINNIGYDLVLPGNWEVVYKKEMMIKDLEGYQAAKICANMFHDRGNGERGDLICKPWWTKTIGGVKLGFIGYTDPGIPKRQPPAYSAGIMFTKPEEDVASYVKILREQEQCAMVFLVTHLGLAQEVHLANNPGALGVDFVLGSDTHERVRKPIEAKYARVTQPGAFGSFVARLDLVVENGQVKENNYHLLEVDPDKYKPDPEMMTLMERERAPYKAQLDQVIGKTKVPLVRYYVLETPMDNMIADALMWKFKPDVALTNGFRFCPPLVPDNSGMATITMDYLWSMLPVNSEIKSAIVTGQQLWDWLEKELHLVFASNPGERLGGWMVRMQGMKVNFTMNRDFGKRLNWVKVKDETLDKSRSYSIVACEREGDPDTTLCRMNNVGQPARLKTTMHDTVIDYLRANSPVAPRVEGRVTATDAPQNLLSQLEGYGYQFH